MDIQQPNRNSCYCYVTSPHESQETRQGGACNFSLKGLFLKITFVCMLLIVFYFGIVYRLKDDRIISISASPQLMKNYSRLREMETDSNDFPGQMTLSSISNQILLDDTTLTSKAREFNLSESKVENKTSKSRGNAKKAEARQIIYAEHGKSERESLMQLAKYEAIRVSNASNLIDIRRQIIHSMLNKQGLDSVEMHDFKSIYVQDPVIYNDQLTPRPAGVRKTKIISCFNCPEWYQYGETPTRNRNFDKCPYSECFFDRHGSMHQEAAMLMFFQKPKEMPPRPIGQIWVHSSFEPPSYYTFIKEPDEYERWKGVFNWTAGYAQDHDFFHPNNLLAWRSAGAMMSDEQYLRISQRKTKTAVWWVSHCDVDSNRDAYVREMQKYIDVDIYGNCGPLTCKNWKECGKMFNNTYKFYLAFENSFCKDYVTTKFFRNFIGRTLIIPVVRGGFDYERYIPSKAYINTKNFKKAKELALYLKSLAIDIPRYAEFLKAKDRIVALNYKNDWCDMCEFLHTNKSEKTIPDVRKVTHRKDVCWSVDDDV